MNRRVLPLWIGLATLASGCAGAQLDQTQTVAPTPAANANTTAAGAYTLDAREAAMDCRGLTGRMQIALLETRGYVPGVKEPSIGQSVQNGLATLFGQTTVARAPDPNAKYASERRRLEAYNAALAAKSCPTFDLDRELQVRDNRVTPSVVPTPKPG